MSYKIRRIALVLCLAAGLLSVAFLPVSGYCENLRFVFLADSPVATIPSNPTPTDLINTAVLTPIINQILALSPQPSFVVYGGDQAASGCFNGTYNFEAFKSVMAPLTNAGIPFYTVLGNRELFNPTLNPLAFGTFYLANQQQYQQAFTGNPANGPSGYERLVYSFESPGGDAFFAVMDPYYLTADVASPNITGTFDDTQLNWLADRVSQTRATHKFIFTHGPYYGVTPAGAAPAPDSTYTNLWKIVDDNRFDIYLCGHVHLYSRKTVDSSIAPLTTPPAQWRNNVVQLIDGTAGATVLTDTPIVDPALWHISQLANTYYFSVVDISGSLVTVKTYAYNSLTSASSVIDSFTINKDKATIETNFLLLD